MFNSIFSDVYKQRVEFLGKWLACVYRSLDELQPDELVLAQLRQLAVVPVAGLGAVALENRVVFFPIVEERKTSKKSRNSEFTRAV